MESICVPLRDDSNKLLKFFNKKSISNKKVEALTDIWHGGNGNAMHMAFLVSNQKDWEWRWKKWLHKKAPSELPKNMVAEFIFSSAAGRFNCDTKLQEIVRENGKTKITYNSEYSLAEKGEEPHGAVIVVLLPKSKVEVANKVVKSPKAALVAALL